MHSKFDIYVLITSVAFGNIYLIIVISMAYNYICILDLNIHSTVQQESKLEFILKLFYFTVICFLYVTAFVSLIPNLNFIIFSFSNSVQSKLNTTKNKFLKAIRHSKLSRSPGREGKTTPDTLVCISNREIF